VEYHSLSEAIGRVSLASQKKPKFGKNSCFSGQTDIRWEHWVEAAEEFQSELALIPSDADAKYNLGFVYLQQSKTDDAAALFEQVVAARPDHATLRIKRGKIMMDRGERAAAPSQQVCERSAEWKTIERRSL
jgi:tetratricopeptide (TPR) repeat protein